ncbi:uncharacterized protein LOC144043021 [Vanacampus margaritifer]
MVIVQPHTMKILLFALCSCFFLHVQTENIDRYAYCESCIIAAKEFEKEMQEAPVESRQALVDDLISEVCNRLNSHKQFTKDKLTTACIQLFDSHYDQFHAALLSHEPDRLDVVLCYEKSTACVGIKRHSFEDSKIPFTDDYIENLLQNHKDNVRITQPIHSSSKDEL